MEWLSPWWSTAEQTEQFHAAFERQLRLEICPGEAIYGIPAKVIGRGDGDDALFELLDGTGRVAFVHLQWAKVRDCGRWRTGATIYESLDAFAERVLRPEHERFVADEG